MDTVFNKFLYEILLTVVFEDDCSYIDLSKMVKRVFILKDYDKNVFPILKIDTMLDGENYNKIMKKSDKAKFMLSIKKYKDESLNERMNLKLFDYIIKNLEIRPIGLNGEIVNINELKPKAGLQIPEFPLSSFFFSVKEMDINKKLLNVIVKDSTLQDTVEYIKNKVDKNVKLIMDDLDNKKIYRQIIIPPSNLIQAIKLLDKYYGFYNDKFNLFFDFNKYFIKSGNNRSNKNVLINVLDDTEMAHLYNMGSNVDDSDCYTININSNDVEPLNNETSNKEVYGTYNIILGRNFEEDTLNIYEKENTNNKKVKIYINPYDNQLREKEFFNCINDNNIIVLHLQDVDLEYLDCDRNYHLRFKNKDYDKYDYKYNLRKSEIVFDINDTGCANLNMTCVLKKK